MDVIIASDSSSDEEIQSEINTEPFSVLPEYELYGIGATLLSQMGYKPGQGLGVNEDGRRSIVETKSTFGRQGLGGLDENLRSGKFKLPEFDYPAGYDKLSSASEADLEVGPDSQVDFVQPIIENISEPELSKQDQLDQINKRLDVLNAYTAEIDKPLLDIDLDKMEHWLIENGLEIDQQVLENAKKAVINELLSHEDCVKDIRYFEKAVCSSDLGYLSKSWVDSVFQKRWYPRVYSLCQNWTKEVGVQILSFREVLEHASDIDLADEIDQEILRIVQFTLPQQDPVEYLNHWWTSCSYFDKQDQQALHVAAKTLKATLSLSHPAANYATLSQWRRHPGSGPISELINSFEDQFDGSDDWKGVLGPCFPLKKFSWLAKRLVFMAASHDSALSTVFAEWRALDVDSALDAYFEDRKEFEFMGVNYGRNDGDELVARVLGELNKVFDDPGAQVWQASKNGWPTELVTVKDVLEAKCEELGAVLVPGTQLGATPRYFITSGNTRIECYFESDILVCAYPGSSDFQYTSFKDIGKLLALGAKSK